MLPKFYVVEIKFCSYLKNFIVLNSRTKYADSIQGLKALLPTLAAEKLKAKCFYVGGMYHFISKDKKKNWRHIVADFCDVIGHFVVQVPKVPVVVQLPWLDERNSLFRNQLNEVNNVLCLVSILNNSFRNKSDEGVNEFLHNFTISQLHNYTITQLHNEKSFFYR